MGDSTLDTPVNTVRHEAACRTGSRSYERRRPATDRSSSNSSQRIPTPRPISRQRCRCSGEPAANRGNQAIGTRTARPSLSDTSRWARPTLTPVARTGRVAEEVTPSLPEFCSVPLYESADSGDLPEIVAIALRQADGVEPEFRVAIA